MSGMTHFPKISYVSGNLRVEIDLDRFSEQFAEAQRWLGDRVLEDSKPFMPFRTGSMTQRSYVADEGRQVVYPGPYARFQYGGKVMVDPETGSPFARPGAVKVVADDWPIRYNRAFNPQATDHWFDAAKAANGEYWIETVKKTGGGG